MIVKAPNGDIFEQERECIEVTRNGLFGGPHDEHSVFIPGLSRYFINGEPVSLEEFQRRAKGAFPDYDPR